MKRATTALLVACFEELFALCVLPLSRPRGGLVSETSGIPVVVAIISAWVCFAVSTPAKVRHMKHVADASRSELLTRKRGFGKLL